MTESSGPYVLRFKDGSRRTVVDTRQEVFDILDAMQPDERHRIRVTVDWREDDGDYVHTILLPEVTA